MPPRKYNEAEMWKSFLVSEHLDILAWGLENGHGAKGKRTRLQSAVERITKGWSERKSEFLKKQMSKIDEDFQKKLEKDWELTLKNATVGEMKIINDLAKEVMQGKKPNGAKDYNIVYKMFRLAQGKSTANNQNTNANLNVQVSEETEKSIADIISRNNAFYNRPRLETFEESKRED